MKDTVFWALFIILKFVLENFHMRNIPLTLSEMIIMYTWMFDIRLLYSVILMLISNV